MSFIPVIKAEFSASLLQCHMIFLMFGSQKVSKYFLCQQAMYMKTSDAKNSKIFLLIELFFYQTLMFRFSNFTLMAKKRLLVNY